jgi:hypothetical protein
MNLSIRHRWLAAGVSAGLVLGTTLAFASPAAAAPGAASAFGAQAEASVDILGVTVELAKTTVGESSVSGLGSDTSPTDDYTLVGLDATPIVTVDAVTSTSRHGTFGSSSSAEIADADVRLFGLDILTLDGVTADTTCVVGEAPTAVAAIANLDVLNDEAVDISDGEIAVSDVDLDGALLGLNLRVEVQEIENTTATTATASALVARVILNGSIGDLDIVNQVAATITLASASCETPTAVTPTITGIDPSEGPDTGNTPVVISGTGLDGATDVTVGGETAEIVDVAPDGTSITVVTPPGTGLADVVVTFVDDTAVTSPEQFLYVSADSPQVTAVDPRTGPTSGGTTVVITGSNLADVSEVYFGGAPATIVGDPTDTRLVVTTPANPAGLTDVVLVTEEGDAERVNDAFLYVAPPTVGTVNPGSGPTTGGTTVTIDGTGFVPGATTVRICGVTIAAANVTVNAEGTRLTFRTPACAAGDASVTVTTAGGTSNAGTFRYIAAGSSGSGTLASTGADALPFIGAAGVLLVIGAALAAFTIWRRRRMAN